MKNHKYDDKFKDECGVFGIYARNNNNNVAKLSYYALYALQHRGQESAGIATNENGHILFHKDMGLVNKVFDEETLNSLKGKIAIGHVRYSTTGESMRENAQPMVIKYKRGQMALAHNGNLVNTPKIRNMLEEEGTIFQTTIDSELILNLISRNRLSTNSIEESIEKVMTQISGAYSFIVLTPNKLVGVRDPLGIRPLCLGKIDNSYILSSESCALDAIDAEFIRDINPGEIITITENNIESIQTTTNESRLCIFEFVYFARPDSIIDGASVHQARLEAGKRLAIEYPADVDLVIGAPDSGISAAIGFSEQSGIPYGQGILKNRYIGRTFIQPVQNERETSVRIKFNAMRNVVQGKRIVMIDDSIVRGTTTKRVVQMLKDSGAKEVHMRVASPPVKHSCYFGIDTPYRKQLIASRNSVEKIREHIGADSLGYLSLEGLLSSPKGSKCKFCSACFDGNYPIEVSEEIRKDSLRAINK